MKTYETPRLTTHGSVEDLTRDHTGAPWGKLDTGEDAWGHRSRIESIDGPARPRG
jgi:cell division protein FtsL